VREPTPGELLPPSPQSKNENENEKATRQQGGLFFKGE
jgi:hypothetical protein